MRYTYHIAGFFGKEDGVSGYNSDTVTISYKLNTADNLVKIREEIKQRYGFNQYVILNIIKLKK